MKQLLIAGIGLIFVVSTLSSCSMQLTKIVTDKLQPAELYAAFDTKPTDLKARSQCRLSPSVSIINAEKRNDDYLVGYLQFFNHYINPKEYMNGVTDYLKIGFEKSNVKVEKDSPKVIQVSLKEANINGIWCMGAGLQLNVEIPETKYTKIYEAEDCTGGASSTAMAYNIHVTTQKIIEDPVIQDYILCKAENAQVIKGQKEKEETAFKSLSQKLQEVKTAFDNGLITTEEYQLQRKAILDKY
jgi:hypothetical protein